ncbi:guanine-nucleotide dissociation stimulator CDC25 [Piedraia hortae CBS 480.64]|uniref:Class E vacuolar protein-sorting machinery protein HSE1 n=1 Tax=Piedraia hortae CBS 480.64 TaxID=1314780 RepID=A0A6A7C6X9_9PEZI|nr:guanine-nucleotide dissociation stimulator CDC25 [Piedraia hortae CBS 480.64]
MDGIAPTESSSGNLYVRALYDFDADDPASLSFRQGDVIQVITQLDSGWWDGMIQGMRGWFPSNYCSLINNPADEGRPANRVPVMGGFDADGSDDGGADSTIAQRPAEVNGHSLDSEEAAFWIPQATPDGRLFYFNTLTGHSTMELPLETPNSLQESVSRDRNNMPAPNRTRVPPELLAAGYGNLNGEAEIDKDLDRAAPDSAASSSFQALSNRRSYVSDTTSPTNSFDAPSSPRGRSRNNFADSSLAPSISSLRQGILPIGTTMGSFSDSVSVSGVGRPLPSHRLFDDAQPVPLTWNVMVEDMRRAVQRYRDVLSDGDRSELVRKAEDISDHLRLLLAAGSGTTDNHSGNPSIISTNKALYPHFREMMSRFSKLVLSSHIAATDWPPPDSYQKCLQEADGVLHGVYGFVEVARRQRGEEIPRLTPGFVSNGRTGGGWQNNGLTQSDPLAPVSFIDDDSDAPIEPQTPLNATVLERMDELKRLIVSSVRRLDDHLALHQSLVSPLAHRRMGDALCRAGSEVVESCRPYLATAELIYLVPLSSGLARPQLGEFSEHKQRLYDATLDLVMACQAFAAPLSDEWAQVRHPTLEERRRRVQEVGRELETAASQVFNSLLLLSELLSQAEETKRSDVGQRLLPTDGHGTQPPGHRRGESTSARQPALGDAAPSDPTADIQRNGENSKVKRFFGEVPTPPTAREPTVPSFLGLDYEHEILYDPLKTDPPIVRGGTLMGLVEHLTRHNQMDWPFTNTFLLTYRSFTTGAELLDVLIKRWNIQPPYGLTPAELEMWTDSKQKLIRFRVVNALRSWVESNWLEPDDDESKQVLQRMHTFVNSIMQSTSIPGAAPLLTAIEQRLRGQAVSTKQLILTLNGQAPPPILPKNLKKLKILDIDPLEFARQLTLLEAKMYGKIKVTECLNKTWQEKPGPGEPEPAENVKSLIFNSNQLTNWVAQTILAQADLKRRVMVIKHFIMISDKCRALNNFSCLTSLISALGSAPIHRLHRTWAQVSTRMTQNLESMRKLMGAHRNFSEYREALHRANPPCIPFLGVFLTDLTFIEDGIPSIIKRTNLINFSKRTKAAEIIQDIQQYQKVPYGLQPVPELQEFITRSVQSAGSVHEMYNRSLQVEPREREDEKIARLLSESGFL